MEAPSAGGVVVLGEAEVTAAALGAELVLSNGVRIQMTGRAATIAALAGIYRDQINALQIGRVAFNCAGRKLHPVIEESLKPVHLGEGPPT